MNKPLEFIVMMNEIKTQLNTMRETNLVFVDEGNVCQPAEFYQGVIECIDHTFDIIAETEKRWLDDEALEVMGKIGEAVQK